MRTLISTCAVAVFLGAAAPWSAAQSGGLNPDQAASAWPRWQGRLSVDLDRGERAGDSAAVRGASLLGDYYITEAFHSGGGGLRATSGLIVSPRAQTAAPLASSLAGRGFNAERRLGAAARPAWTDAGSSTQPYLGVGYTGVLANSGFSFSADLGVVRLGRAASAPSLDEQVRALRLSPILSLGVSYAF